MPEGIRWTPRTLAYGPIVFGWLATALVWKQERLLEGVLQAGILLCAFITLQTALWTGRRVEWSPSAILAALVALIGVVQISIGSTAYQYVTREASLQWLTLAAVALVARNASIWPSERHRILSGLIWLSALWAVIVLSELSESAWRISTLLRAPSAGVAALAFSSNEYAELVELALPVALMRCFRDPRRAAGYAVLSAVLVCSVIGVRARMGTALVIGEVIAILWITKRQSIVSFSRWRVLAASTAVLCLALAASIGIGGLWQRVQNENAFASRSVMLASSAPLIREGWLAGHGLATFASLYPANASAELRGFVNHAHNDWVEAVSDGGLPFLAVLLILFGRLVIPSLRQPWSLGILAVSLHALVDFPFHRTSIMIWIFTLMGALESASASKSEQRATAKQKQWIGAQLTGQEAPAP